MPRRRESEGSAAQWAKEMGARGASVQFAAAAAQGSGTEASVTEDRRRGGDPLQEVS
jgi:hypothetical protein